MAYKSNPIRMWLRQWRLDEIKGTLEGVIFDSTCEFHKNHTYFFSSYKYKINWGELGDGVITVLLYDNTKIGLKPEDIFHG